MSAPARSTNVSPSSLVKNTLPSTATGDAENPSRCATPSRPCHRTLPLVRCERGDDARHVVHHVELLAIQNRRRDEWRPARAFPGKMRAA